MKMKGLLRKILVVGIVALFLGAVGSAFFRVNMLAYAAGAIYIRADGSVEGTTDILSTDNVTYVFVANVNDSIVVERSNIIVDGDGYTLNGSWSLIYGFNLTSVSNVTIMNVNIVRFGYAMWIEEASQCVASNNTCVDNEGGIWLVSSVGSTVSSNNIMGSVEGVALDSSSGITVVGNSITNNYYGVYLVDNSTDNTVTGNNVTQSHTAGIYLDGSSNNFILGNNVKDSPNEHIELLHSSNSNTISGNTLTNSTADVGIYVYGCSLNSFFGNNITSNADTGIRIDSSADSTISENNISENLNGVYLWYCSNVTVSGNNIAGNSQNGIYLEYSNENAILNNEFYSNPIAGIYLLGSSDNIIWKNTNFSGYGTLYGVVLWGGSHNTVSENTLSPHYRGIAMGYSDDSRILNNTVSNTELVGIEIQQVCNNSIIANNVVSNGSLYGIAACPYDEAIRYNVIRDNNVTYNVVGIYISRLSGNVIYHNNFVENTNQTSVSNSTNIWDDGYPSGGNYWSDYNGTDQYEGIDQNIPGNDGIGDTPYEINVDNLDRYPLMSQYEPLRPLFLESEERWNLGDTSVDVWSVFALDVDDDGVVEIMICAQVNQSAELRVYGYDGLTITLEHAEMWNSTEGEARAWSVFAADVDGDGVTEILTGAETHNGQNNVYFDGQLRIWDWNGTVLTLEHSEEWHTGNNTHVYSVFAYDVDNDGEVEIITGGDAYDAGNNYICELRVWSWNGTELALEASEGWRTGFGETVWSVRAFDVDGDGIVEIVTAGQDDFKAQLRIWNWNGTVLTMEHSEEWLTLGGWMERALSVFASDIDNDGIVEIVTFGEAYTSAGNSQLRVWNWNGSSLVLETNVDWPLNGTSAYAWTICAGDVDRDGSVEVITEGISGSGAQLRVWSFNGSTLKLDANQESPNEWVNTVFACDADGDGTIEIITAGVTYEAMYGYEQVKVWSFPESIPPTITIISPENKTYAINTISLTFAIDEPTPWISYSLDDQANETISGNITLPALLDGIHHVVVYANDTYGNMGMSMVYFTVDPSEPDITDVVQDPLTDILPDTVVRINATVTDVTSGIKQVLLNCTFTNSTSTWYAVYSMTHLTGDVWNATIMPCPYGTNVTYVIIAEDNAGNTITTEQIYGYKYEYPVVPEFQLSTILFAFLLAPLFLIIVFRKKRTLSKQTKLNSLFLPNRILRYSRENQ